MTVTVKQYQNENYYISLEIKTNYNMNHYEVSVYPILSENECGYPIRSIIYSMDEKQKASATFNRYKKAYT